MMEEVQIVDKLSLVSWSGRGRLFETPAEVKEEENMMERGALNVVGTVVLVRYVLF